MSGDVQDVEVSSKTGAGLDELIEKILLQAELLELKARPDREAEATVIEAKLDKGRGPVATVLINRGTLRRGDTFVVGTQSGRVRAMVDDKGKQIKEAGPSHAGRGAGPGRRAECGRLLTVVENEQRAREVAEYRQEKATELRTAPPRPISRRCSPRAHDRMARGDKADVQGSVEAIVTALHAISNDLIKVRVLQAGRGCDHRERRDAGQRQRAPILGFNVRPNPKARELIARQRCG